MPSNRMNDLSIRTSQLREHLLPVDFNPTGDYEDKEKVISLSRSFRVLFHAEIETYFEDRVIEIAKIALKSWKERRHISIVSMHLLGFGGEQMSTPPSSLKASKDNKIKSWPHLVNISGRLENSIRNYIYKVQDTNNGIRERNILAMLIPIGVEDCIIDELMLASLDQLGVLRGATAHSSISTQVTAALDPEVEFNSAINLLTYMEGIDGELDRLLHLAK